MKANNVLLLAALAASATAAAIPIVRKDPRLDALVPRSAAVEKITEGYTWVVRFRPARLELRLRRGRLHALHHGLDGGVPGPPDDEGRRPLIRNARRFSASNPA